MVITGMIETIEFPVPTRFQVHFNSDLFILQAAVKATNTGAL